MRTLLATIIAAAALVGRPVDADLPQLVVDDPLAALDLVVASLAVAPASDIPVDDDLAPLVAAMLDVAGLRGREQQELAAIGGIRRCHRVGRLHFSSDL